jgi:ABC-2 type transport system ATP-binding protein
VASGARQLAAIVRDLDRAGVLIDDLAVRHPSLDDVFLTLTGRATGPDDGAAALAVATGKDAA